MVLYDWQRGKIPFYTLPADYSEEPPAPLGASGGGDSGAGDAHAQQLEDAAGESMFAQAVTADDAAGEAGARPENAAAAAAALRAAAAAALRQQRRQAIPIKDGYYLPDDEQHAEDGAGDSGDCEELSGGEELYGSEADDVSSDASEASTDSSSSSSGGESDGQEEEEGMPAGTGQQQGRKRKNAAALADDDAADGSGDEDESDGYGDDGLSWEAVLQAVQVRACVA